jgi:hypothetical protein
METLTLKKTFALDIVSDEPNFETFKDQLKAHLANCYDVDFSKDDLCNATIGAVYHDWQIKELADLIFGQSEEIFTDIIKDVKFVGNGFCKTCGGSTFYDYHYKTTRLIKGDIEDPGEYRCHNCNTKITIE